jgi:diguanylate cyclase (GGDEF)-like protein
MASMEKVAVLAGPGLARALSRVIGKRFAIEPLVLDGTAAPRLRHVAALVALSSSRADDVLRALRKSHPRLPVGSLASRTEAAALTRSLRSGFDFHVDAAAPRGIITAQILTARRLVRQRELKRKLKDTSKRLAILTNIVKTANEELEPRRVIELIMAKIQRLIPSEAWSMLMVDEERQELTFELALGEKGKDVASFRVKMGEGIAGWVAQTGRPAIVNDTAHDPRFARRFDSQTHFHTRSILCAPLTSRGRTIGVVQVINRVGGRFTRDDLKILLTLVEPCAIAIENAMLFQRAEQLTITDDLTKLFNSRYLNLYLTREIKRSKRHAAPLAVIFLDLDGFKNINDQYGHLAGSRTLTEVGSILSHSVRETDTIARYGGDEFVVVLPETPAAGAMVIAERIRKAIEGYTFLEAQGLAARLSASFGIACYPEHALTPEGLIQKADQAMYRVKERSKNGLELAF